MPRLRLTRNELSGPFVAVRLEGAGGNRDAIGGRVELHLQTVNDEASVQVRTVRAGEGYLSQSSKWLHFGLAPADRAKQTRISHLIVRWPDGTHERITGVEPGRWYHIRQQTGHAAEWVPPTVGGDGPIRPTSPAERRPVVSKQIRIVPHQPIPLPTLPYMTAAGRSEQVAALPRKVRLIVLWSSTCMPCLEELKELATDEAFVPDASVDILPMNVDRAVALARLNEGEPDDNSLLHSMGVPWPSGTANREFVERVDMLRRSLVSFQDPLAVPSALLIDVNNQLVAFYVGKVDPRQVVDDANRLALRRSAPFRDLAVPLPGRWYVNEFPADVLAVAEGLYRLGHLAEAEAYLDRHVRPLIQSHASVNRSLTPTRVANSYTEIGVALAKQGRLEEALAILEKALACDSEHWSAHAALAGLHTAAGRLGDALREHREMLRVRPDDPVTANNVAWILATSPDVRLRDPDTAIRLAHEVCRKTNWATSSALDTLAAAYAAAGQFDQAVATCRRAIEIAENQSLDSQVAPLKERLAGYERREPFVDR